MNPSQRNDGGGNSTAPTPYVTFQCGESLFGIDIGCIQEINRNLCLTRVPLAPAFVRGVVNLRGAVVTMLDLRVLMGLRKSDPTPNHRSLILHSDGETFGLWVDSVSDIVAVSHEEVAAPPSNLSPLIAKLVLGVHSHETRLILLLDPEALFAASMAHERTAISS